MRTLRFFMFAMAFALITVSANAQNADKQRMTREQMIETQAKHIASELALDDNTYKKFITTYTNYKKELWTTAPRRPKKHTDASETEEQAAQNMQRRFEQSQKVLDIRNKYYKEFSKFMTQKQIEQMYDKERKIMKRLKQRHDRRQGNKRQLVSSKNN